MALLAVTLFGWINSLTAGAGDHQDLPTDDIPQSEHTVDYPIVKLRIREPVPVFNPNILGQSSDRDVGLVFRRTTLEKICNEQDAAGDKNNQSEGVYSEE